MAQPWRVQTIHVKGQSLIPSTTSGGSQLPVNPTLHGASPKVSAFVRVFVHVYPLTHTLKQTNKQEIGRQQNEKS